MTQNTKRISLLLLCGALAALMLLSASLSNLQLRTGDPFPDGGDSDYDIRFFIDSTPVDTNSLSILKGIFALLLLILMIYVPARLIALVNIKRIFQLLFAIAALLIMIIVISQIPPEQPAYLPSGSIIVTSPPLDYPVSPPGKPPQGLTQLVLIGFVLGVGFLALKILRLWLYSTRIEEQFLQEAESAMNAIVAGGDLRNVIVRCYLQMTHALQEERRIKRNYNMTVREFDAWLEFKGFPPAPVHQLTHLFEKVRYGTQPTTKDDEKTAVGSLNEIIQFCRSRRD